MKSKFGKLITYFSLMISLSVVSTSMVWASPSPAALAQALVSANATQALAQQAALASARSVMPQSVKAQESAMFQLIDNLSKNTSVTSATLTALRVPQSQPGQSKPVMTALTLPPPQAQALIKTEDGTFVFSILPTEVNPSSPGTKISAK